ncbi:MAG: glycosyltransferase [Butyrivibrio sp.]|nr:glycosyltransferase [Butyrivibrio sp.]
MNEKKVLLSISMLISGREEMKKSLESLHSFREALPCEIILVDTGCNAEQRVLAEQYADKIVDFVWCNDFAAARNAGLKEAKGEWFLYLDDDEWFEDPKEIITFFTSGEYERYNSASYIVRNYTSFDGAIYNDSYPSRMCRIEPETRFIGKIHEFLSTFREPKRMFSAYVHHYGYVYKDESERGKRVARNVRPLLEMVEQYPSDPRWTAQLVQEYFSDKQFETVLRISSKWLEERKEADGEARCIGCIYAYAILSLYSMKLYSETEKWLQKALAESALKQDYMEPTAAFFYMMGARLYAKLENDVLCKEYMRKYLDCYKWLKDDRQALEAGAEAVTAAVFQENFLYGTVLTVMGTLIRAGDQRLTEEVFYIPDWQDERLLNQQDMEKDIVDAVSSVPRRPLWGRILQTLVSRKNGMQEMIAVFLEAESRYEANGEKDKSGRLMRLVSELSFEHCYNLCAKILWTEQDPAIVPETERTEKLKALFRQMFESFPREIMRVRSGVWKVAEGREFSLESLFSDIDYPVWKHSLEDWCLKASLEEILEWEKRVSSWKTGENSRVELLRIKCQEGLLNRCEEAGYELAELEEKLWRYSEAIVNFYGPLYREKALAAMSEVLPEELQLALRLKSLRQCRKQGDDRKSLEAVRKCLGIYWFLEDAVEYYAGLLRDEVQQRNQEADAAQKELNRMIESLIAVARQKILSGAYREARDILLQVCQYASEDKEAEMLLERAEKNLKENTPQT